MSYLILLLSSLLICLESFSAVKCGPIDSRMRAIASKYFTQGKQIAMDTKLPLESRLFRNNFNSGVFSDTDSYVKFQTSSGDVIGKVMKKNTDGSIKFVYLDQNGKRVEAIITDSNVIETGQRITSPDEIRYVKVKIDPESNVDRIDSRALEGIEAEIRIGNTEKATSTASHQARNAEEATKEAEKVKAPGAGANQSSATKEKFESRQGAESKSKKTANENQKKTASKRSHPYIKRVSTTHIEQAKSSTSMAPNQNYLKFFQTTKKEGLEDAYVEIISLYNQGIRPSDSKEMNRLFKKLYNYIQPDKFKVKYPNTTRETQKQVEEMFKDIDSLRD